MGPSRGCAGVNGRCGERSVEGNQHQLEPGAQLHAVSLRPLKSKASAANERLL